MSLFWLLLFVALIFVDRLHRNGFHTTVRVHQFRFYGLRDALREAAVDGQIDRRNWVFLYLDSSIAKTISVLDVFSIWRVLATLPRRNGDERLARAHAHLYRELDRPQNALLRQFHNRYVSEVLCFLYARHFWLRILVTNLFSLAEAIRSVGRLRKKLRERLKDGAELQTEVPESSTLLEYA